jgi:hypothetical protein
MSIPTLITVADHVSNEMNTFNMFVATKLPTDNGSFYNVFSSAQTVSPLMLTAFGVVFAALF